MGFRGEPVAIVAVLIILTVLILYVVRHYHKKTETYVNPWAGHDKVHAAIQGSPDAPQALLRQRELIPQLARAKAQATPEELHRAERAAWFSKRDSRRAHFDTERMMGVEGLISQDHETAPEINWQDGLVDLVADRRMRENQAKWNEEMQPFSSTWLKVDTIDEAAVHGLGGPGNAVGLYAFSRGGPQVHNPWQLTEVGPDDFSAMRTTFRFNG
jgi:hypothetical protein